MGAELAPLLAGGSVFAVLGIVIVYLLSAIDRISKRADDRIDAAERRADEATARGRETQLLLDQSTHSRRAAEDQAADLGRQVRVLGEEVKLLRTEVEDLRAQLGYATGGPT